MGIFARLQPKLNVGRVVGRLYITKRRVNERNTVNVTRSEVLFQKELRFSSTIARDLDSLDYQTILAGDNDVRVRDIVEFVLANSDDSFRVVYSRMIIGVNDENIDVAQTITTDIINTTEMTKRLEKYTLQRDFSQPTPNDLEASPYEGYDNRLKMVTEAKEFSYFRKFGDMELIRITPWDYIEGDPVLDPDYISGENNEGTTYEILSRVLGTDNIARVTASDDNLRDVLDEIFSAYNSTARLDYINPLENTSGSYRLKMVNQSINGGFVNLSANSKKRVRKSIDGNGTTANPTVQNVVGQDNLANNGVGRPFVGDGVFTDTATAKQILEAPIKDIEEFWIYRLDREDILGNANEVDIANNIIKASQRDILDEYDGDGVPLGDSTLYKNNVGSYTDGGYDVDGFGIEFEGNRVIFIGAVITTVWENILRSYSISTSSHNTDIRNWGARIIYRTLTNEKVEVFRNNFDEQAEYSNIALNVVAQTADFKRVANELQDKIEKTGNDIEERIIVLNGEKIVPGVNWFEEGQVDIDTGKKIFKKDCTLSNGNLTCIYYTSADAGYLNALTDVDSLKRASAIEGGVDRDLIINDFVNIGFSTSFIGSDPSVTEAGLTKFMDTFRTSNSTFTEEVEDDDGNVTEVSVTPLINRGLIVSNEAIALVAPTLSKKVGLDYAKVGFKANNPVYIGFQQSGNNSKRAVRYALRNGTIDDLGFVYGKGEVVTNIEDYNKSLPLIRDDITGEDPFLEGVNLINLGDVTASTADFVTSGPASSFRITGGSADGGPGSEATIITAETNIDADPDKDEVVIPQSFSISVNLNGDNNGSSRPGLLEYEGFYEVYVDDIIVESGTIPYKRTNSSFNDRFAFGDTLLEGRSTKARVFVSLSIRAQLASLSANIICSMKGVYQDIIPPTVGQLETKLSIKKTPNEILGLFHGLNAIKNSQVITGEALFTRNGLYSDERFDSFKAYFSTDSRYVNSSDAPRGTYDPEAGYNIIEDYPYARLGIPYSRVGAIAYGLFGVDSDGTEHLIMACNSKFGETLGQTDIRSLFTFDLRAVPYKGDMI